LQGRSLKAGEILSKVYMYSAEEEDLAFTLVLDSMIVTEGDLSAKVKAHVRERLGEDYLPWDRVRVREKIECRLGTAMKRGKTLKQTVSALRDGVGLALQVVAVRPRPPLLIVVVVHSSLVDRPHRRRTPRRSSMKRRWCWRRATSARPRWNSRGARSSAC
jgi:hypothetical protein